MCARYTIISYDKILKVFFNVTIPANLRLVPRFNVAPTQQIPVITNNSPELQMFRWGLTPSWAKSEKTSFIIACAETLAEKPSFRTPFRRQRCLIPADGFYEWRLEIDGTTRTPLHFTAGNGDLFAFAGLWDTWRSPSGEFIQSCALITTTPNELMEPIHDRMPVILPRESYATWLSPADKSPDELLSLLRPYPANEMSARQVSRKVNSSKIEGPELLASESPPAMLF